MKLLSQKNPRFYLSLLTLLLTFSCKTLSPQEKTSETQGFLPGISKYVTIPRNKNAAALDESLAQLHLGISKASMARSGSTNRTSPVQTLGSVYIELLVAMEGIPRPQGEELFLKLLSSQSAACGGVSCSKILEISEDEVPRLFDAMFTLAASSTVLAQPDKAHIRRLVLGSLLPDFKKYPDKNWESIGPILFTEPQPLPQRPPLPNDRLSGLVMAKKAGEEFIKTVNGYTGADFKWMNLVESLPEKELLNRGLSQNDIKKWRAHIDIINRGLAKLPVFSGPIYRGVGDINHKTLNTWIQAWHKGSPIALGRNQGQVLTSCSWDPSMAETFLQDTNSHLLLEDFSIFFVIKDHKGVSIEDISKYSGEHEVLLPSQHSFLIESIAPLANRVNTLIITLKGISSSAMPHILFGKKAA